MKILVNFKLKNYEIVVQRRCVCMYAEPNTCTCTPKLFYILPLSMSIKVIYTQIRWMDKSKSEVLSFGHWDTKKENLKCKCCLANSRNWWHSQSLLNSITWFIFTYFDMIYLYLLCLAEMALLVLSQVKLILLLYLLFVILIAVDLKTCICGCMLRNNLWKHFVKK